jgi:hypothetical protein
MLQRRRCYGDSIMAGFNQIFCIGGVGGFNGSDGINPIELQILVGDGNRRWLESHYFDKSIKPIGRIKVIIPEVPEYLSGLIDACIAFAPKYFEQCPSMDKVKEELKEVRRLDFDQSREKIPESWYALRKEATPFFEKMNIFEGNLREIYLGGS